jgi:hypothetical protein
MAPPYQHAYGNQQQQYQQPQHNAPPAYGYYPPYQAQQPVPYRRAPRQNYAVVLARQLNIGLPIAIIILSIWWSFRSQVCPSNTPVGHECSWMLWTTLPVVRLNPIILLRRVTD